MAKLNGASQAVKQSERATLELAEENAELRKELSDLTSKTWQSNSEAKACIGCQAKFTTTRRRHHCRHCGRIFCDACSSKTLKLPSSKTKARVCDGCFDTLA